MIDNAGARGKSSALLLFMSFLNATDLGYR
jgi:hypothetical protein